MRKVFAWIALALTALGYGSGVPRRECFPIEILPKDLRAEAEAVLLKALDGEALYTIVGGLKPMSSGFLSLSFEVDAPKLDTAEKCRQILSAFRCGNDINASMLPFWRIYEGKRYLDAFVFNRRSFAHTLSQHRSFFSFYGVSPGSQPGEVLLSFEVDATARRNRGYGYLFGYPKYAVDFFVDSEEQSRRTKKFVERDFFSIDVFSGPTNRFVWAVPKGHRSNTEDLAIKTKGRADLGSLSNLAEQVHRPR